MKLKSLYLNRINTLKSDLVKADDYISKRNTIINEYVSLMKELLLELKTISNNENIEPNIKYIQLNEKTSEIEKIYSKMEELYNDINKKATSINKERDILLQNCIEDHSNLSEKQIIDEFLILLSGV